MMTNGEWTVEDFERLWQAANERGIEIWRRCLTLEAENAALKKVIITKNGVVGELVDESGQASLAALSVRARLRDLRDQWMEQQKAVDNGDIVVTDHIYEDCAEDVSPLLVDPLTAEKPKENGTGPQAGDTADVSAPARTRPETSHQ